MYNRFKDIFSNLPAVFPVIHVQGMLQAIENVRVVSGEGVDGVFLINHGNGGVSHKLLFRICEVAKKAFPNFWVGVNCLDLEPEFVFSQVPREVNGVWTDNAGIIEAGATPVYAEKIKEARKRSGWDGLYFGGVAFKYQLAIPDKHLRYVAMVAMNYMDVIVTSGPATGVSPTEEKVMAMREGIGDFPLAIASGMTPENVKKFVPHVSAFLVATGISKDFFNIDPYRLRAFMRAVRE